MLEKNETVKKVTDHPVGKYTLRPLFFLKMSHNYKNVAYNLQHTINVSLCET